MMDGLVLGIDLCDEYMQICCAEEDQSWMLPTVICKHKTTDAWYIGEDAYAHTLFGDGIIVDKLVKLTVKNGMATLGATRYQAAELLKIFLGKVLEFPEQKFGTMSVSQLVLTIPKLEPALIETLYLCFEQLQIPRKRIHIISRSEAFTYYVLSQKREIWNNQVGLFHLTAEGLCYYELKVQRGLKKTTVFTECETMEEGFNLDILDTPSGARLADKILCSCGERLLQRKLYSSVFLSGKGFEQQAWAEDFMKFLCSKRKVYVEPVLFARGAAFRAADFLHDKTSYPFIFICDGRLKTSVSLNVLHKGQDTVVTVAAAGDNWYECDTILEVIPDEQDTIDFLLTSLDGRSRRLIRLPLEGFPKRPNRTTKVRIQISFLDDQTMVVLLTDRGFGELFPASKIQIRQEVML